MRLLLIRHGQTPSNVRGALDTARPGPGLTSLGEQQAKALVPALREEPLSGIYASVLQRTQLTAAPLGADRDLPVTVLEGLQEIEAGALEDRADLTSQREYMTTVFAWGEGELGVRMLGGSDGHAFYARYDEAISRVRAETGEGTAAVFSHGAAIRCWLARRAVNTTPDFFAANLLPNAGVVVLEDGEEGWELLEWPSDEAAA